MEVSINVKGLAGLVAPRQRFEDLQPSASIDRDINKPSRLPPVIWLPPSRIKSGSRCSEVLP